MVNFLQQMELPNSFCHCQLSFMITTYSNGTLGGFYGNGSGNAVMEQVNCTGYEDSLEECKYINIVLDQFKCVDGGAATVMCDFETGIIIIFSIFLFVYLVIVPFFPRHASLPKVEGIL